MTVAGSRLRQIGWAMALGIAFLMFVALSFRVNAVRSDVVRAERTIISLKQDTMRLETEFETRANQQQLANWNAVDFGYTAPRADQYIRNERELASLSQPSLPGAPDPIRVARADVPSELPAMVSPLTGRPVGEAVPAEAEDAPAPRKSAERSARAQAARPSLAERLGMAADMGGAPGDIGTSIRVGE